jgi:SAM-dependent methyltransferase
MTDHRKEIAEKWRKDLEQHGYDHANEAIDIKSLEHFPRVWKKIFSALPQELRTRKDRSAFEVGTGGARHLVSLALNGWRSAGIDVSKDVLDRAHEFIRKVESIVGRSLNIELILADLFDYSSEEKFDVVFHFGVIEHFLEDEVRLEFLRKMFELTRPGGYVLSVVPSGVHPERARFKNEHLGGYDIPEIDYGPDLMRKELEAVGAKNIEVLPHNLFGYFPVDNDKGLKKLFKKLFFYAVQLLPASWFPKKFSYRHAYSLIAIGRKAS